MKEALYENRAMAQPLNLRRLGCKIVSSPCAAPADGRTSVTLLIFLALTVLSPDFFAWMDASRMILKVS